MKIVRWIDQHIEEVGLVLFSSTMVSVIFIQVIARQLDNSLSWSEELARYCFIWLVYLGISYGVKKNRHIQVDVVLLMLKERGRIILNIISTFLFMVFAIIVIVYGYKIAHALLTYGQQSPALHIPMGMVYMATPVGMGLTLIRLIQNLIQYVKALFDEGEVDSRIEAERIKDEVLD